MTAMTRSSVIGGAVLGQAGGATVFGGRLSGHLRRPRPQRPRLLLPTPGRPRPLRGRQGRKGRPRCPRRATAMTPAAGRASCRGGNRCSAGSWVAAAGNTEATGEAGHGDDGALHTAASPWLSAPARRRVSAKPRPG